MVRRAILLSLFVVLPFAGVTSAPAPQTPSDAVKAMVGKWEFSDALGEKVCNVVFSADSTRTGMKIEFEQTCFGLFPFVKDITGWRLAENDFLRLLNAKGASLFEFSEGGEVGNRMFEAPRPGGGLIRIQQIGASGADITPEQMNGNWTVVRGAGKATCTLTLSGTPVGDAFALKVNPGCEPFVTRFAPVSWRLDRGGLTIVSARGETWLFEADDPANWHRIPLSADPVNLVRK